LDPLKHGWERFGENNSDTTKGYIEGAWMTKYNGKYYLQYAAPGTEFNVYADGAYFADRPLGPYRYLPNNPFSFKPGGFMNGAGHGSTVKMLNGDYWHFSTMALGVNMNWERRICMFPTFFDSQGLIYCDVDFGDYPHFAPNHPEKKGKFTGWMLLSYKKPVKSSSDRANFKASAVTDENVKTFWVAERNDSTQWLEIDLEKTGKIYAVQVNYFDFQNNLYGRIPGIFHRYTIESSLDGKKWERLIDRSNTFTDVPNDYIQLADPRMARYLRYHNIHVPMLNLAISDIRVFGIGSGKVPQPIKNLQVTRSKDRLDALLLWNSQADCQGVLIRWGIAPDKLYNSWMVYDQNSLKMKCLTKDQPYYFSIMAFNESGVGRSSQVVLVQ
jgi:hypothetical protein